MKIRLFLSPFFLSRWYLYKDIKYIADNYEFKGEILDIGCGTKPYKNLFLSAEKYNGIDFKHFSNNTTFPADKPDFYFSRDYLKNFTLPFSNNSYDHTFSFQVLEHHPYPQKLIKEMYRITKRGGYILLSVPFINGIHEEPNDFQRFTKYGLIQLFKNYKCKVLEVKSEGYFFTTISMLINENICNFANKSKINYLVSLITYPPFLLLQYISYILEIFSKSEHIVRGYLILVKK